MSVYWKDFDETKYMSFLIEDNKLLEKYKEIWDKVSNEKYLKTKTESYEQKIKLS